MPQRIQRKRTSGWRMPKGAVYVGRPSKWGNPFTRGRVGCGCLDPSECTHRDFVYTLVSDPVEAFRRWAEAWTNPKGLRSQLHELRGKDLACWCPLDQPCHADVLLKLANTEASR